MSSSRSLRPWPRRCTTPHEDRGRPGPGRRRASCTTRTRTGRLLLTSRCSSACTKKSPAGGGLPAWQSCRGRRSGYSDTPWCSLPTSLPWCPLLLYLSCRWWAMVKHVDSVVPSRFPRTVLREPQLAEQLWKCLSLPPSLQRLGPLGGDLQAHGSYVAWWLRMVPHRQPRAVYKILGQDPRRRSWYRAASVPVHRQSGGNPWLRLSRQLRKVQTVQFCGVRGELQRQVPAVPNRL